MSKNAFVKNIAVVAVVVGLVGCASGPAFRSPVSAPADHARLDVYIANVVKATARLGALYESCDGVAKFEGPALVVAQ